MTLRPPTRICPCDGSSSRKTSFRNVVLPAPEGPVRKQNSPFLMCSGDVGERGRLAVVLLVDVEGLDHRAGIIDARRAPVRGYRSEDDKETSDEGHRHARARRARGAALRGAARSHRRARRGRSCACGPVRSTTSTSGRARGRPGRTVPFPHILGNDIAGEVVSLRTPVEGIAPGERVMVSPGTSCGRCRQCLSGEDSSCRHYRILGYQIPGGYAELRARAPSRTSSRCPGICPSRRRRPSRSCS